MEQKIHLRHIFSPQYLHPPSIKQRINSSAGNPSTVSVKVEEVEYAIPLPQPQDHSPDAHEFPKSKSFPSTKILEVINLPNTLSPQCLLPPGYGDFNPSKSQCFPLNYKNFVFKISSESRKEVVVHTIFTTFLQDPPPL